VIDCSSAEAGAGRASRKILRSPAALVLPHREALQVRLHYLSTAGAGVVASLNLKQATACEVRFNLPWSQDHGHRAVTARATVGHSILSSRQGGFLIGLDFIDIDERSLGAISRYMRA
jgi:hypothetical protein